MARKIVGEGLILNLDAKKPKNNNWLDLSKEQNKAKFVNYPIYDNKDFGSFVFNGKDQYARLPVSFVDTTKPFTAFFVFKAKNSGVIFGQTSEFNFNESPGYVPALYVDTNGKLRYSFFWHEGVSPESSENVVIDNDIHIFAITVDGDFQVSYLDGEKLKETNYKQCQYSENYFYTLGNGRGNGWSNSPQNNLFEGNIYDVLFYERKLTNEELLQNYDALKR